MKKITGILISIIFIIGLCSCTNNLSNNEYLAISKEEKSDFDFILYNSNRGFNEPLTKLCNEYQNETGIKIKILSLEENNIDNISYIKSILKSTNSPTIISLERLHEIDELKKSGYILDLYSVNRDDVNKLLENIPYNLQIDLGKKNHLAIPIGIEGFGYIINKNIISNLVGKKNVDSFINDFKLCTYEEYELFVKKLSSCIKNHTSSTIVLNNVSYQLDAKSSSLKNLTSAFSIDGTSKNIYSLYLINNFLYTVFESPDKFYNSTSFQLNNLSDQLEKYLKSLNLITSHVSGPNAKVQRNQSFIDPNINGYESNIINFSLGKSVFLVDTQKCYYYIKKHNDAMLENLEFLPIKIPLDNNTNDNDNNFKNINSSILVSSPFYYSINSKATDKEKKLAVDFIVWLNNSSAGKDYVTNDLMLMPLYIDTSQKFDNPINNSINTYIQNLKTIPPIYLAYSSKDSNIIGENILSNYLTKQNWSSQDYKDFANHCISTWKS